MIHLLLYLLVVWGGGGGDLLLTLWQNWCLILGPGQALDPTELTWGLYVFQKWELLHLLLQGDYFNLGTAFIR